MILHHINHKMPIYKDCTLVELMLVSSGYVLIGGTIFSFLSWLIFGYASIGFALTLLTMVHVSRLLLGRLQKLKYGKPYGYYQQFFLKQLSQMQGSDLFWRSPFLVAETRWSIRRSI